MRTTSQPRSARTMPVKGAIAMPASSRTVRNLSSARFFFFDVYMRANLLTPPKAVSRYHNRRPLCYMPVDIVTPRLLHEVYHNRINSNKKCITQIYSTFFLLEYPLISQCSNKMKNDNRG